MSGAGTSRGRGSPRTPRSDYRQRRAGALGVALVLFVLPVFTAYGDDKFGEHDRADSPSTAVTSLNTSSTPVSEQASSGERPKNFIEFIGRFHPVSVHFAIALILTAALAEALFLITGRSAFTDSARFMLVLGAAGAVVAVGLGFATREEFGRTTRVTWHLAFGLAATVMALLAAVVREARERHSGDGRWRWVYRALLFLSAVLVSITGHLGGLLTRGPDAFSWP
jgi:uncharacterized membrane protein